MRLKPRLEDRLGWAREYTEHLLSACTSPREWTYRAHPKANHALWIAGHLALMDNMAISLIAPERAMKKKVYAEEFGQGSVVRSNPNDYPPPKEVLHYMRERRIALLEILDGLREKDLARPTPEEAPKFMPDVGSVFFILVWHEGLHSGQLSVIHRALGHPYLI